MTVLVQISIQIRGSSQIQNLLYKTAQSLNLSTWEEQDVKYNGTLARVQGFSQTLPKSELMYLKFGSGPKLGFWVKIGSFCPVKLG